MENTATQVVGLDWDFWLTLVAIVLLLLISAFFSGSETALTAASRGKLHAMADKGNIGAKRALRLTDDSERLIGAILLGNNLVNILAASLATSLMLRLFGESGVAFATIIMTLLVLVFAEVLPKTYAILRSEHAAQMVSLPVTFVVKILSPVVLMVQVVVRGILRLAGIRENTEDESQAAQEEIAGAIALGHIEGNFQRDHRDRLLGALDLQDREVREIMLHRSDIEMVDADAPPQEIVDQILASPHTRLPVFQGNPENIVGIIHAKDLLRAVNKQVRHTKGGLQSLDDFKVLDVTTEPYFVPETTSLEDQMHEFLRRRTHFALVVDEYGDLQGLITLEDIIEEIIGEITDEHDEDSAEVPIPDEHGTYLIDGGMTIRDLNRALDWQLPDEEANTIAGLVIHEAQMIPDEGQVFTFHGFRFDIAERIMNKITKLRIRKL